MLNTTTRYFLPFIVMAIAATLSSCSSSPTSHQDTVSETPAPVVNVSQTSSMAQLRAKSNNPQPSVANKSTNVTLYTSDVQCQSLIPQAAVVPAQQAVTDSVSKILEQQDTSDLSLSGYRLNIKNGIATVDLRVAPESKRQLASLSNCEQFALFGSLRKTLTSNAQWKIKQVRFVERGEEIVL